MRRYRCDLSLAVGSEVEIETDLFKHIIVVCRNQIGQKFELLKNEYAYLCEVVQISKKSASLKILEKRKIPELPKPYVHLVLANPKVSVLESVVEKSVELGVRSIFLLTTERSFFKSLEKIKLKEARLQKIISQALQQSNRFEGLKLEPPSSLSDFLAHYSGQNSRRGFFLYEKSPVSSCFEAAESVVEDVYLLVGPEGGFAAHEASAAVSAGFETLSLGQQILRVETACVAGVSILKSKLQIW